MYDLIIFFHFFPGTTFHKSELFSTSFTLRNTRIKKKKKTGEGKQHVNIRHSFYFSPFKRFTTCSIPTNSSKNHSKLVSEKMLPEIKCFNSCECYILPESSPQRYVHGSLMCKTIEIKEKKCSNDQSLHRSCALIWQISSLLSL